MPVTFTVPVEAETVVEGQGLLGGLLGSLGFAGFNGFDLSSKQEFENNNTRKDQVTDVRLSALSLAVTAPEGASLDFIDQVEFYASAPGEARILAASGTVPANATQIDLDIEDVDLSPYVRAERMTLETELTASSPEDDTTVRAEALFTITAEVDAATALAP